MELDEPCSWGSSFSGERCKWALSIEIESELGLVGCGWGSYLQGEWVVCSLVVWIALCLKTY